MRLYERLTAVKNGGELPDRLRRREGRSWPDNRCSNAEESPGSFGQGAR